MSGIGGVSNCVAYSVWFWGEAGQLLHHQVLLSQNVMINFIIDSASYDENKNKTHILCIENKKLENHILRLYLK